MSTKHLLGLFATAIAACGGGGGAAASNDAVVAAWKSAKLDVSAMTDVDPKPYSATKCRGGTVSGVDVVLCTYGSGEDAQAAEDLGLDQIGAATGVALARGDRLLVAIDRRKVDPSGRTLDAIAKAFRK